MVKQVILICLSLFISGCVSTSLETDQFRPVGQSSSGSTTTTNTQVSDAPVALGSVENTAAIGENAEDPQGATPQAREQAVQEIRAKAQTTSGEKTHIGALPETAAPQMTASEQAQKAQALKAAVDEANASVGDAEVQSKQESIRRLRKKAASHYDDAVKRIEN